jgi:hypothetical protein
MGTYDSRTYIAPENNSSSAPMLLDIGLLLRPPYTIAAAWGRIRFLMLSVDTAWPTMQQLKAWTQTGASTQLNNTQVSCISSTAQDMPAAFTEPFTSCRLHLHQQPETAGCMCTTATVFL